MNYGEDTIYFTRIEKGVSNPIGSANVYVVDSQKNVEIFNIEKNHEVNNCYLLLQFFLSSN